MKKILFDSRLQDLDEFRLDYLTMMDIDIDDIDNYPTDEGLLEYYSDIKDDELETLTEQFAALENKHNLNDFLLVDNCQRWDNEVIITEYMETINDIFLSNRYYIDIVVTINNETGHLEVELFNEFSSMKYNIVATTESLSPYVYKLLEVTEVEMDNHIEENTIKLAELATEHFATY